MFLCNGNFQESFNSRPHKEVDRHLLEDSLQPLTFQFTTSQGGRLKVGAGSGFIWNFQFTTSQGGRRHSQILLLSS